MNEPSVRQARHIEIHESIERLSQVDRNLLSLIEEISGHDTSPNPTVGGEACNGHPCLLSVLNGAGDEIASLSEGINAKIGELRTLLF